MQLPLIGESLDLLASAKIYTKLDVKGPYNILLSRRYGGMRERGMRELRSARIDVAGVKGCG